MSQDQWVTRSIGIPTLLVLATPRKNRPHVRIGGDGTARDKASAANGDASLPPPFRRNFTGDTMLR
jgi:hypothetical protein